MACCTDREDAVSMALTAVSSLLAKYRVAPSEIGRIEVGTESAVDCSKPIASHVAALLQVGGRHLFVHDGAPHTRT